MEHPSILKDEPETVAPNSFHSNPFDSASLDVDLGVSQESSLGLTLFKLCNGASGNSTLNEFEEDDDDYFEQEETDIQRGNLEANNFADFESSKFAPTVLPLNGIHSDANKIQNQQSNEPEAPIPLPTNYPNAMVLDFNASSNFLAKNLSNTNLSMLEQSVQSLLINNSTLRRGSCTSIKTSRSTKYAPGTSNFNSNIKDSKLRVKYISETLRSLGALDSDILVADYPCWLLRQVLLKGRIYITNNNIFFTAFLPATNEQTLMNGSLNKRTKHSFRATRRWFVLSTDQLAYYTSAKDFYFPAGVIDLHDACYAELIHEDSGNDGDKSNSSSFQLVTENKTYCFNADNSSSAQLWVKSLQYAIFLCHNDGEQIKLNIPIQNIISIKESTLREFGATLKLKIIDSESSLLIDKYVFMFLDLNQTSESPTKVIQTVMNQNGVKSKDYNSSLTNLPQELTLSGRILGKVSDSTNASSSLTSPKFGKPKSPSSPPSESNNPVTNLGRSLTKKVKNIVSPSQSISSAGRSPPMSKTSSQSDKGPLLAKCRSEKLSSDSPVDDLSIKKTSLSEVANCNYSDFTNKTGAKSQHVRSHSTDSSEKSLLPSFPFLPKKSSDNHSDVSTDKNTRSHGTVIDKFTEIFSSPVKLYLPPTADDYIGLDDVEKYQVSDQERIESNERFRKHFSLGEDEHLVATYYSHIHKPFPLYGKLYVGTKNICFRSLLIGTRTKMILPIKDIESISGENESKFGCMGILFAIHGYEDVFFEFSTSGPRENCESVIRCRLNIVKTQLSADDSNTDYHLAEKKLQLARLRTYEKKVPFMDGIFAADEKPPIVITNESIQSTSIAEKPFKSLHFTMLTIGSRGDVQPYIALAKGLMKEGHKCRIATHTEFQSWIEKHGIEFGEVAGDPGELMKIMIEHGMVSVSFLREASTKFRGWIDELLSSAWKACQNTDVLIESPSAMVGIHIAEALKIPYFRAFTMPWTRTRTYPHAFMVSDQNMGGSYNHLTYVLFDNVLWRGIAGQVNKFRINELGLEKTNLDLMDQTRVPFLYNVSPSVLVPPVDYPSWIRVSGYWFLDEGGKEFEPPQDLVDFIKKARDDNKKLIYIGFGSIVVSDPKGLTECVVQSVLEADVRCILAKGWSDRFDDSNKSEVEVQLPSEIFQIDKAPHDWLFPQVDAAVHHGGSGTTGASLRAGIPTIIKPFFGDQFFYAGRVEELSVGVFLKKLSVNSFSKAIIEATTNEKIINSASSIGKKIRSENGVADAIAFIYWQMDHAIARVKEQQENQQKEVGENGSSSNGGRIDSIGPKEQHELDLGDTKEKAIGKSALIANAGAASNDSGGKISFKGNSGNIVSGLLSVGAVGSAVGNVIQRTLNTTSSILPKRSSGSSSNNEVSEEDVIFEKKNKELETPKHVSSEDFSSLKVSESAKEHNIQVPNNELNVAKTSECDDPKFQQAKIFGDYDIAAATSATEENSNGSTLSPSVNSADSDSHDDNESTGIIESVKNKASALLHR